MKPIWRPSPMVRVAPWPAKKTNTVFALHLATVGEFVAQHLHDALAGGILVEQLAHVVALEAKLVDEGLLDGCGIVDGVAQPGPALIIVDPDDHGPAFPVQAGFGLGA